MKMPAADARIVARLVPLAMVSAAVVGCSPPRTIYRPPADIVALSAHRPLEVTLRSGERIVFTDGRVSSDTLHAMARGGDSPPGVTIAVPVSQIASISETGRQIGSYAGGIGFATGILIGAAGLLVGLLIAFPPS